MQACMCECVCERDRETERKKSDLGKEEEVEDISNEKEKSFKKIINI